MRTPLTLVMLSVVIVVTTSSVGPAEPSRRLPDLLLKVAVRQKQGSRIDQGIHLFELFCTGGRCALQVLSLNQCFATSDGKSSFHPKIERFSTQEGNLKVTDTGSAVDVEEINVDVGGRSTTRLRMGYAKYAGQPLYVTSFSGAYVKQSDLLKKVISIEYIPLQGAFTSVDLDCPIVEVPS